MIGKRLQVQPHSRSLRKESTTVVLYFGASTRPLRIASIYCGVTFAAAASSRYVIFRRSFADLNLRRSLAVQCMFRILNVGPSNVNDGPANIKEKYCFVGGKDVKIKSERGTTMTRSEKLEAVIRELRRLPLDDTIIASLYDQLACGEPTQSELDARENDAFQGQRG